MEGYGVFSTSDFESRIIGGYSFSQIAVSTGEINSVNKCPDICFAFTEDSLENDKKICGNDPVFFVDSERDMNKESATAIPVNKILLKEEMFAKNIFFLGLMAGIIRSDPDKLNTILRDYFSGKSDGVISKNKIVVEKGHDYALKNIPFTFEMAPPQDQQKKNIGERQ